MESFRSHTGIVAPMDRANVDTDAIIPKQFLKSIRRSGFGQNLFDALRYMDLGEPDTPPEVTARRPKNPNFVLNQARYEGASILLARKNFGCGSSREHAPWALQQYGFRAVIAPSFADIFYNNCFKNGFLPVVLSETQVDQLFHENAAFSGFQLTLDLEKQTVSTTNAANVFEFEVGAHRKFCLVNGFDDIGLTLRQSDAIRAFEAKRQADHPYYFRTL